MKWKIAISALMMIFVLGSGLKAEDKSLGKAVFVLGRAKVITADKVKKRLRRGYVFQGGETILTGRSTIVKLRLSNGSEVKLMSNSKIVMNKVQFASTGSQYSFGVVKGGMHSKVNKLAKAKSYYRVYTPSSVAGVRGTEFLVSVGVNGKSNVLVKEGLISLEGEEQKTSVKGGEEAEIDLEEEIKKEEIQEKDEEKANNRFQRANRRVKNPVNTIKNAEKRMKRIERRNKERLRELQSKKKLSDEEQQELEVLYQKSVNQSKGLYGLSRYVFKRYRSNRLVRRNFYRVQRRLRTINDQIKDMDQFISKMSKEIEDFTSDTSKDIEDLQKNFGKKRFRR